MLEMFENFLPSGWLGGEAPDNKKEDYKFGIYYNNSIIAYFDYNSKAEIYKFEYTDEGKKIGDRAVVPDFPDQNKVYNSKDLSPFLSLVFLPLTDL